MFLVNTFLMFFFVSLCGATGSLEESVSPEEQRGASASPAKIMADLETAVVTSVNLFNITNLETLMQEAQKLLGSAKFKMSKAKKEAIEKEVQSLRQSNKTVEEGLKTTAQLICAIGTNAVLDNLSDITEIVVPFETRGVVMTAREASTAVLSKKVMEWKEELSVKELFKKQKDGPGFEITDYIFGVRTENKNTPVAFVESKKWFGILALEKKAFSEGKHLGMNKSSEIAFIQTPVAHLKNVHMLAEAICDGNSELVFIPTSEKEELSETIFRTCHSLSWDMNFSFSKKEKEEGTLMRFREDLAFLDLSKKAEIFQVKVGLSYLLSFLSFTPILVPRQVIVGGGMCPDLWKIV